MISLSLTEAKRRWEKAGKTGPDTAPPIEWEERTVGKNGSNPRTVRVPKGIDPGFAYNPGKAWLEPYTVPPLQGYDAVLKERGAAWPTGFTIPAHPVPTVVPGTVKTPHGVHPEQVVSDFLHVFGADMEQGAVFIDAANTPLVISKALFEDGEGNFKWLESDKADRLGYMNILAMTLIEPDEIWWAWEIDASFKKANPDAPRRWRLKRRYLRIFEIEGENKYVVGVFEWNRQGWSGSTIFSTRDTDSAAKQLKYFDGQRKGRLVYKK